MSFHNIDEEDFGSDESGDEDYVPCEGNQLSEEEDSGDDESLFFGGDDEEADATGKNKKGRKRQRNSTKRAKKLKADDGDKDDATIVESRTAEETQKQRADMLWDSFLKDVGGVKKNSGETKQESKSEMPVQKSEKVTIVKEYDFAGETVRVTKEVDANSKEAKNEEKKTCQSSSSSSSQSPQTPCTPTPSSSNKKSGGGGLSGLLDRIQNKPKMSVLDKSKLDWNDFKSNEGIGEELQQHNRGKNGYLERIAFLQRVDLKQYEVERDLKATSRRQT